MGSKPALGGRLWPKCVAWVTTYPVVCLLLRGSASSPFAVELRTQHGIVTPNWHAFWWLTPSLMIFWLLRDSFPSSFCGRSDLLERNFCTRYPLVSLFFSSKSNTFGRFGTFLAHIRVFFLNQLPNQFESIFSIFFTFCGQFDLLEGKPWGCHPFLWLFSWLKKWHLRQFWHISSTYWRIFSESFGKQF